MYGEYDYGSIPYGGTESQSSGGSSTFTVSVFDTITWVEIGFFTKVEGPLSSLQDNFNDNVLNPVLWTDFGPGTVSETNQRLEITATTTNGSTGIYANLYYYLDKCEWEVIDDGAISGTDYYGGIYKVDDEHAIFGIDTTSLFGITRVAGNDTEVFSIAHDPVAHRFLRIRSTAGTTYWETSPDTITWTTRHSEADPIDYTECWFETFLNEFAAAGSTTAILENFNTVFASLSVNDNFSLTENVNTTLTHNVSVFDTFALTENHTELKSVFASVNDNFALTEDVQLTKINLASVNDNFALTDNVTVQLVYTASVFDTFSLTEAVTDEVVRFQSVFDTFALTESVTNERNTTASVFDTFALAESVSADKVISASVFDAFALTENVNVTQEFTVSLDDNFALTDTTQQLVTHFVSVFDTFTLTESTTTDVTATAAIDVFDTFTLTEDVATEVTRFLSVFDTFDLTDVATPAFQQDTFYVDIYDEFVLTENVTDENNLFIRSGGPPTVIGLTIQRRGLDLSGATTNHGFAIPSGSAGDVLLLFFGPRLQNGGSVNTPANWDLDDSVTGVNSPMFVFSKVADGTEGATVTVTTTATSNSTGMLFRLSGSGGDVDAVLQTVTGTSHDSPSLTPDFGDINNLWFVSDVTARNNYTLSGIPTNYGNLQSSFAGNSAFTVNMCLAVARRAFDGTTEDPDAWTLTTGNNGVAGTVAVSGTPGIGDDFALTESVSVTLVRNVSVADTFSITENVTTTYGNSLEVNDTFVLTEAITTERDTIASVNDTFALTENIQTEVVHAVSVFDTFELTESVAVEKTVNASVFDTFALTENIQTEVTRFLSVFDAFELTEAVERSAEITPLIEVGDDFALTEAVFTSVTRNVSVFDALEITEDVTTEVSTTASVFDTFSLMDSVQVTKIVTASVFDTFALTESVAASQLIIHQVSAVDIFDLTENVTTEVSTIASVFDAFELMDAVSITKVMNTGVLFDTFNLTDVVTDTETIRFSPEAPQFRPRGIEHRPIPRGRGSADVSPIRGGSISGVRGKGNVTSR